MQKKYIVNKLQTYNQSYMCGFRNSCDWSQTF